MKKCPNNTLEFDSTFYKTPLENHEGTRGELVYLVLT